MGLAQRARPWFFVLPMIQVLPPLIAERIAAGEVIERPSSAVKELLENALDAGATEISVRLEEGGKSKIEITDNGRGMSKADLELCVLRHATSKIRDVSDLETLKTLGFRGEALPSIAAVSELSIVSREQDGGSDAFRVASPAYSAEAHTFGHFLGSPHGTQVVATGLFSQIPARLKFLKSDGAETAAIREWMERLAIARPGTGFKLESRGKVLLSLRPEAEDTRARTLLSEGGDYPLASESEEFPDGTKLRAYWIQGLSLPQSKRLVQVVNGRVLRDRLLQQASMQAFRQALLPGQYPALALFLELDPAELDVNVHPTKTEVRFLDSRTVFSRVHHLIERMIRKAGVIGFAGGALPPQIQVLQAQAQHAEVPHAQAAGLSFTVSPEMPSFFPSSAAPSTPSVAPSLAANPYIGAEYAGILFQTYLLFDFGQELGLVDQHAAHERIRFEDLRKSLFSGSIDQQSLLLPTRVSFAPELREEVEKKLPLLEQAGFEAELFGEDSLLFRSVPAAWGTDAPESRLKSLLERVLIETSGTALDERMFEALASEACHSSVRAGDRLNREEALSLVSRLFACEHPWNCPHGRPTTARVPRARFEEWFSRRVNA